MTPACGYLGNGEVLEGRELAAEGNAQPGVLGQCAVRAALEHAHLLRHRAAAQQAGNVQPACACCCVRCLSGISVPTMRSHWLGCLSQGVKQSVPVMCLGDSGDEKQNNMRRRDRSQTTQRTFRRA